MKLLLYNIVSNPFRNLDWLVSIFVTFFEQLLSSKQTWSIISVLILNDLISRVCVKFHSGVEQFLVNGFNYFSFVRIGIIGLSLFGLGWVGLSLSHLDQVVLG